MNFNALVDCFFNLYLLKSLYKEHENNKRCDNHGNNFSIVNEKEKRR